MDKLTPEERQKIIDEGVSIGIQRGEEKAKKKIEELTQQMERTKSLLEQLENKHNMTAEEKKKLEEELEELRHANMSGEEKWQSKLEKTRKELQSQLDQIKENRDTWKTRYETEKIHNALLSAATKVKAYNPRQIVSMLEELAVVEEETDEKGKPTGKIKITFPMTVKGENGTEVEKELSPEEAVKAFISRPENANLVADNIVSSPGQKIGGSLNIPSLKGMSAEEIQKNMPQLIKLASSGELRSAQ